jgi:hypothetical protein
MSSPQEEDKKLLIQEITSKHVEWQNLRRVNRNWDGGLTVSTIILTLFMAFLGVEGINMDSNLRKALIGISGGIVVAIQSIGNAFPVKQRAGGYKMIESQAYNLKSKLGFLQEEDEIKANLPQIQEEYYKLIVEAAKLES